MRLTIVSKYIFLVGFSCFCVKLYDMDFLNTISNNRLWNKHGLQAVWGLALFCALLSVTTIIWSAVTQSKTKQLNYQAQVIAPVTKKPRLSYRINDIIAANLFGDPNPTIVVKKAPKTTLDLTLQGILWATDPNFARAIIMSGKKKSELYSVGENIKGAGASIKEIRNGEVLLNRNGTTESLALIKKTSSGNRVIITFTDPNQSLASQASQIPASASKRFLTKQAIGEKIKQSNFKQRAKNGAPRKVRKPNFSGLDRVLKRKEGSKNFYDPRIKDDL